MEQPRQGSLLIPLTVTSVLAIIGIIAALNLWSPSGRLGKLITSEKDSMLAAAVVPTLGTTINFAVLAGASIVDSTPSLVIGNVGLFPASGTFIGIPCAEVTGTIYASDPAGPIPCSVDDNPGLNTAKNDLTAAYTEATNETPATTIAGGDNQLGGKILTPGIYTFSAAATANLIGTLTLDGQGDPNAIFIFQTASTLVTAAASVVNVTNGTQPCNVFWQVGSSATLGTGTQFKGTIMADQSITDAGGSTIIGRLLARAATVTLNNTSVTVPSCSSGSASLRVIKLVVNTGNGGTATPADFNVHVKLGGSDVAGSPQVGVSSPGTLYSLSAGTYAVSEDAPAYYLRSFTGDCDSSGNVIVSGGATRICTIVNTDVPLPTLSYLSGIGGGSSANAAAATVPVIGITKVPSPLTLATGSGPVTYNYRVWNIARQTALVDVTVTDDKCSPVRLVSGDDNNNGRLDLTEIWNYSCSATLTAATTNTAIATGFSDDGLRQIAIATAVATVGAGGLVPPLINIVKVPSRLTPFPVGGGDVTYSYTVTNPGVVALHDVIVTDDNCSPVTSSAAGDTNSNSLLDTGETWTYTCRANISISTRNVATARGEANGLTAISYAFATVLVSMPSAPSTGFPPRGQ